MNLGLKRKTVLITAASKGIGKAAAEAFASEGCNVAICSRTKIDFIEASEEMREKYNVAPLWCICDLNKGSDIQNTFDAVKKEYGSVDILVNNCGGPVPGYFLELVEKRQSVRKYLPDPVSRDTIEHCITAARLAPSACNSQPWHFIIIDDPDLKNAVAANTHGKVVNINHFTNQAPVIIAIISERQLFTAKIGNFVMKKRFILSSVKVIGPPF